MKYLSLIAVSVVFAAVAAAANPPNVYIPKVDPEVIDYLFCSDYFVPEEWQDAASVNDFRGALGVIPENTTFFLMHDGERLLTGVYSLDKDPSSARAFVRGPEEDFSLDDSVQLLIGPKGSIAVEIRVGGYEDAYNAQNPVNDFYGFACNMAGSIARSYNETPMAEPNFLANVMPTEDGWFAVILIDFAQIGVDVPEKTELLMNLFRFYRGTRYGWYLPSFGGYAAMPFARAIALPEDADPALVTKAGTPPEYHPVVPGLSQPPQDIVMEYYPIAGKVTIQLPMGSEENTAFLAINDKKISTQLSSVENLRLDLPVDGLAVGEKFTARAWISDPAGAESKHVSRDFTIIEQPDWGHTAVAQEYLDDVTPKPWTAPVDRGDAVALDHGTIEFGDMMLPQQIRILDKELLSGPITVTAIANGEYVPMNLCADTRVNGTSVTRISGTEPGLEVLSRVEFDGFTVIRMRLNNMDARELEELTLSIPLASDVARYVIQDNSQFLHATGGHGKDGNFEVYSKQFWVGNEQIGIEFSNDYACVFSPYNGYQYSLSPETENGSVYTVRMVTAKGQVPREDQIFQFFIQPTPTRREIPLPGSDGIYMWHENWSDYQAYPDMTKVPAITARANELHNAGRRLFMYFGHVMQENAPGFKEYGTDLMRYPDAYNGTYFRMYDPGKGIPCRAVCFRDAAGDLLIDRIEKLVDEADIDGLYFDGPTVPFPCETIGHDCSDSLNASWDENWHRGRTLGQRAFLKRIRGIFDSRGKADALLAHTGGAFHVSCLGLCDYFYDGEHLNRYRYGYLLEPWKFIMGYTGKPFGWRGNFVPGLLVTSTLTLKQALAWTLIHATDTPIGTHPLQTAVFSIFQRDPDSKFYDYWHDQPHIVNPDKNFLVSYFLNDREAFVVASNITYRGTQKNTIDISNLFPGRELDIYQVNTTEPLQYADGKLTIELPVTEYRIYHVMPADANDRSGFALPSPVREIRENPPADSDIIRNSLRQDDWTIVNNVEPVPQEAQAFNMPIVLQSEKGTKVETEARFNKALPMDFKIRLKLAHQDNMRFWIDNVMVRYDEDDGWIFGWLIEGVSEFDLKDYCQVTLIPQGRNYIKRGTEVEVVIIMKDGRLTFLYDDCQILTEALPAIEYHNSHRFQLSTWGGDYLTFDMIELTDVVSEDDIPVRKHPIY